MTRRQNSGIHAMFLCPTSIERETARMLRWTPKHSFELSGTTESRRRTAGMSLDENIIVSNGTVLAVG